MTKQIKGILAGIGVFALIFTYAVVGNYSPKNVQASGAETAISLNLTFSEVLELVGLLQTGRGEGNLGAASGYAHYQKESFLQGLAIGGRDQFNTNNEGELITQLVLYNVATAPTGVEGGLYYDTDDSNMKLFDGASWFTVGTTTDGIAKSGSRLALDDLDYYLTLGTTTQSALSIVTIEATSTVAIPLTLRGFTAQTANLFQVHDVAGSELFALDSAGNASTTMISTGALWASGSVTFDGALSVGTTLTVSGETVVEGFTQGGGCTASTTAVATELWTEADMLASNCFVYSGTTALSSAAITITLPASTTMTTLLPSAGKSRSWFYDPSGYDAATTTTFAAGTGIILMEPDDDSSHNVVIAGATSMATIDCMRRADTDVYCLVTEFSDAD